MVTFNKENYVDMETSRAKLKEKYSVGSGLIMNS